MAEKTEYQQRREMEESLKRIEAKLDEVLLFTTATTEAIAPFLSGKGHRWLALVAKTKGGKT
jgi:hypothetical protein